jgi:spore germination protein KC
MTKEIKTMNKLITYSKKGLIGIWISLLSLTTGCWDYQELNDYGFVMAVGIDKSHKKGEYLYTFQLVNPGVITRNASGSQATPIATYSQTGRTKLEAIRKISQQVSRRLFFSHLQVFVISEEILREGAALKVFDVTDRDPQGRINFPILAARNTQAYKIISALTPIDDISANELRNKIETSKDVWGENRVTLIEEVIENVLASGRDIAISGVELTGDSKQIGKAESILQTRTKGQTKLKGIALFNMQNLVQWADDEVARGVMFGSNKVRGAALNINCSKNNNHRLTVIVNYSKTKIKAKITKNKPAIDMKIEAEGRIGEAECPIDLENPDVIHELEQRTSTEIKKEVELALAMGKKTKSDVFGFGDAVHQADPETWTKWKKNWKKYYSKSQVDIHTRMFIRTTGLRTNPYMKERD